MPYLYLTIVILYYVGFSNCITFESEYMERMHARLVDYMSYDAKNTLAEHHLPTYTMTQSFK